MREGKGDKDRFVPLPNRAAMGLERQNDRARRRHDADLAAGFGRVFLPNALSKKYIAADSDRLNPTDALLPPNFLFVRQNRREMFSDTFTNMRHHQWKQFVFDRFK